MARPRNVKQVFREGDEEQTGHQYNQPRKNSIYYNGKLRKKKAKAPWWWYVPVNVSPITGDSYEAYKMPRNLFFGSLGSDVDPEDKM